MAVAADSHRNFLIPGELSPIAENFCRFAFILLWFYFTQQKRKNQERLLFLLTKQIMGITIFL